MAGTNPRAARIAALIQRVIASSVELELHDPRLENVTITEVRVTNDLQLARVFWTQLGDSEHTKGQRQRAAQALEQAKGRLRSHVGTRAGLRLTPVLEFHYDEIPSEAVEIEDILAVALKRDQDLEKVRQSAQYAGDSDPYKHEPENLESEDSDYREFDEPGFDNSDSADKAGISDEDDV